MIREEKDNKTIPERLLIWFKGKRHYYSKQDLAAIIHCQPSCLSPAFSKLRDTGYVVLMTWNRKEKCWTYCVV